MIDVTRKSVEETAASIIKIYEITKNNDKKRDLSFSKRNKKKILEENGYQVKQEPSRIDEEEIKISMEAKNATCLQIAKSLAELKASKN